MLRAVCIPKLTEELPIIAFTRAFFSISQPSTVVSADADTVTLIVFLISPRAPFTVIVIMLSPPKRAFKCPFESLKYAICSFELSYLTSVYTIADGLYAAPNTYLPQDKSIL